MATSKRSKKRPFSLSLSQTSTMESSRLRRKKNVSSQDCDASDGSGKILSMVSEEEYNPRRKLVEEWLERNNSDNNMESADENSQDTVLLENNCHIQPDDQNDRETDQVGEDKVAVGPDKVDQAILEDNVTEEGNLVEPDIVKDSTVKLECVEERVSKPEDEEDRVVIPEDVKEQENQDEAGTSSGPAAEEEPLLQCPLCWKNFEKVQSQAAHLKACAAANGLTTRQLIDAVDLHKKQLAERKRLGLFPMAAPSAAPKKSAPKKAEGSTSRKPRQSKDSNLELALALSLSLAQGEDRQEQLNAFGFISKTVGPKKSAPVLLTRTQAERERLITEKVAIVLMDEPDGSQPSNNSQEVRPSLLSPQLQEWCNQDHPLWKKSRTSPTKIDTEAFYVSALGDVIIPNKTEVGANLRHLSQLPGRINTPKKRKTEEARAPSSFSECHSAANTQSLAKLEQDVKAKHLSDWASMLKNSSMSDVTIYVCGGLAIPAHKLVLGVRCPQILRDVTKQQSPVTGLHIDVILWPDTSNDVATCFLEYIYYGSIRSIHTLRKDTSGLQWLADRYEASDLLSVLSYFERKKRAVKSLSDPAPARSPSPAPRAASGVASIRSLETVPVANNLAETVSLDGDGSVDMFPDEDERPASRHSILSQKTEKRESPVRSPAGIELKRESRLSDHSIHSQTTVIPGGCAPSPDIFSEEYDFALSPSPKSKTSRDNATKKLSFESSLNLDADALARIDALSTGSTSKRESLSSRKSSKPPTTPVKNTTSSESDKSLRKLGSTPKSPAKVFDLSPSSDFPAFDNSQRPSDSQRGVGSQRPVFPADDDDIVVISDDEEEKDSFPLSQKRLNVVPVSDEKITKTVPESRNRDVSLSTDEEEDDKKTVSENQKRRDVLAMSTDEEDEKKTVADIRKGRDLLAMSTDEEDEQKTVAAVRKGRDLLAMSTDEEDEKKTVVESRKRRDLLAMSTDKEEEKKTVAESRKRCDLVAVSSDEEDEKETAAAIRKARDLLAMSTDKEEEKKTVAESRKRHDLLAISSDEEEEIKCVTETREPHDVLSMSTESLKSGKSPSPRRNSPYISPVWNGFDDMACDFDMGQNWEDGPVNTSPPRGSRVGNVSPVADLSRVRGRDLGISPVRGRGLGISPVRGGGLGISPVHGGGLGISPVRGRDLGRSPVPGASTAYGGSFGSPARRRLDTSPVRSLQGISPRGKFQGFSPGNNKVHDISDSGSSDEDPTVGNIAKNMLDDSMNAILASSHLDALIEHRTPKRKKRKDEGDRESGWVTPMKNYRDMTSPEIKVELQNYGMKPGLGKRKGVLMLEHIYNQLHPFVPENESVPQNQTTTARSPSPSTMSSQATSGRATTVRPPDPSSSSSSSSSSAEGLSDVEADDSDSGTVANQRGTKKLSAAELPGVVTNFIEMDRVLHRKILEYEPIFIEHLHSDLKANGFKIKIADLMAYLGEKCINYRSEKQPGSRTRKKNDQNGNPKKKRQPDLGLDLNFANFNDELL